MNKVKIVEDLHKAVLNKTPETVILKKMRGMIQASPDFNIREKAALYKVIKRIADLMYIQNGNLENSQIKNYSTSINKIEEHKKARLRRVDLATKMRESRASAGVFYMSSIHSNPAKDHAEWQGKVYVDRYWKSVLEGDLEAQKRVAAYIRNHNTMTVQEVIGAPVYLITRPYCKHFFIKLDTDEVMGNGVKAVQRLHPEAHVRTHNLDYRKKFYKLRARIRSVLDNSK